MIRRNKKYRYDPLKAPKAKDWLSMSEDKRSSLIEAYHRRIKFESEGFRVHVLFHLIVENQAALRDQTPVAAALKRLEREGLDRHEALHAIGSVLAKYWYELMAEDKHLGKNAFSEAYFDEVKTFSAQQWYDEFG